jgi:hypothetical protein
VDSEPAVQGETENEKLVVAVELNGEDKVDDEMPVVEAPPASNGLSKLNGVFNTTEVEEVAEGVRANRVYNEWVLPTVTGRSPSARYQHAAEVVNNKLYVIGGNHSGRYLNDVQFLDLKTFEWSKVEKVPQSPLSEQQKQLSSWFPPCAGHSLIRWGTKLLAVAGRSKEPIDTVTGGAITLRVYKYILWLYSELDLFSFLCASSSFDCLNVSSNYCVLCVLWVCMQCVLLIHIL